MKKVFSIILILAALFGLFAGYTDLQDVMTCKSYWEQKGEESDANLDKLEAGLTTLQENEQAYKDGLVTVAEGEASLEKGKETYAAGLEKYNAGVEEYNAGLETYNQGMEDLGKGRGKVLAAKDKLSAYTDTQKTDAVAAYDANPATQPVRTVYNGVTTYMDAGLSESAAIAAVDSSSSSLTAAQVQALYDAGKLATGVKAYNAGLMDYYVAKGTLAWAEKKLTAAKEQLDAAEAELAEGKKTIEEGEAALEAGKKSLAEYEDGEAQVKDGLAQVVATKADAGLTSIADRLGAGFTYTDGDRLLIDKGFEALAAAREYSSENGALVTKELTSRAAGAIIVMVAAVLAILAGIIGIIKGGKLSGILAIVAAAAAIVGAALYFMAGTTMSAIAGSTGSATLLLAAGACVAVVGIVYGIMAMISKAPAATPAE